MGILVTSHDHTRPKFRVESPPAGIAVHTDCGVTDNSELRRFLEARGESSRALLRGRELALVPSSDVGVTSSTWIPAERCYSEYRPLAQSWLVLISKEPGANIDELPSVIFEPFPADL